MTNHDDARTESILLAQRAVIRALHETSPSWLELNLSMAQLKALFFLSDQGPQPVGQIGCRLGVTLPTASYQVERLVRAGLVDRVQDERDRRRTLVHLTDKATDLLRSLRQGRADLMRSWIDHMSPDDVEALERGLGALAAIATEQARRDREQPSPALAGSTER
jgi:MarR family transcriptional regulator, organic hydroperoxide resistance regulator